MPEVFDIPLPQNVDCDAVERMIEDAVQQIGLRIVYRASLKKFPGCMHWHVKNGHASGTLEITLWPQQKYAWFTIQKGRTAPWIRETIGRLGELLQMRLGTA